MALTTDSIVSEIREIEQPAETPEGLSSEIEIIPNETEEAPVSSQVENEASPSASGYQWAAFGTSGELSQDTIEENPEYHEVYGILLQPPQKTEEPEIYDSGNFGVSYILLTLFLLFALIALRFHNNRKFVGALLRNLVEVKERQNMFDETVRETSFLIFLNMMWCACAGVILYSLIAESEGGEGGFSFSEAGCMGICMGIAVVYTLFMGFAYLTVGNVFSDRSHAAIWLKGFTAGQGILGFFYFPLALAFICYPEFSLPLLWVALVMFVAAKAVFIWKGFRIFFTQISSWVLFLYYLCSLEIVPLILTYIAAVFFCRL